MTVAPKRASMPPIVGPAMTLAKSTTLVPSSHNELADEDVSIVACACLLVAARCCGFGL